MFSLAPSDILQFLPELWPEKLCRTSGGAHGRTFPNVSKGFLEFSSCLKAALEIHSWRDSSLAELRVPIIPLSLSLNN